MYYVAKDNERWMIKHELDGNFLFGPINDESDAYFIMQMFLMKKIQLVKDDDNGKEGTQN